MNRNKKGFDSWVLHLKKLSIARLDPKLNLGICFLEDRLGQTTEIFTWFALCPLEMAAALTDFHSFDWFPSPDIMEFLGFVPKKSILKIFWLVLQLTFPVYPSKEPEPQGKQNEVDYGRSWKMRITL